MAPPTNNKILLQSGTNEVEFLRLSLGAQLYGVNVAKVRQVVVFDSSKLCPLPDQPPYVLGNYNYRGELVPTIDLGSYFKIEPSIQSSPPLLLILELNGCVVGCRIDGVDRIMRCSWSDFRTSEQQFALTRKSVIVGTAVVNDEMTPIIDVEAILSEIVPSAAIESQNEEFKVTESVRASKKLKIVCCEDSGIVRKVLLASLRAAGYDEVVTFTTGREALDYLTASPRPPVDVIISDIEMPAMDGLTLCRTVRADAEWSRVPFFFFSSTINEQMKTKCASVGGTDAFSKPQVTELIGRLRTV